MAGHPLAEAIVTAARACVGTRFRAQGRSPGLALDCVGVALAAASAAGARPTTIPAYQLGGREEIGLELFLLGAGCSAVAIAAAGDLRVVAPATGRRHLAVDLGSRRGAHLRGGITQGRHRSARHGCGIDG